jgi:cell division protein FtsX
LSLLAFVFTLGFNRDRQSFWRYPHLYSAPVFAQRLPLWTGGAIMAWILVKSAFALLNLPVRTLAALYSSDFELHGLSLSIVFILVLCGPGLGLIGSWLAVEYYLRKTNLGPP